MTRNPTSPPTPIGQRLKAEMQKQGITSAELARRADVKISFLYDILSGKSSNPSPLKLAQLAETLEVSLEWLIGSDADSHTGRMGKDYVTIPRVMIDVSAGGGSIVSQEAEGESYYFRKAWIKDHLGVTPDDLRLLYVRGDSMEPTLQNNDMIMVDTTRKTPTPPGIFVLYDGMGLVAKRLEYITGDEKPRIRIISDNPHYSAYERTVEETLVIGRVVWFAREM